jgi:ribosome-binding factor A
MSDKPRGSRRTRFIDVVSPSVVSPLSGASPTGHRHARLEHLIHDALQAVITDEATDPSLDGVRLVSVTLSLDSSHARIGYAVEAPLAEEPVRARQTKAGLARASSFLRARLAEQLELKKLPRLSFVFIGLTPRDDGGAR